MLDLTAREIPLWEGINNNTLLFYERNMSVWSTIAQMGMVQMFLSCQCLTLENHFILHLPALFHAGVCVPVPAETC